MHRPPKRHAAKPPKCRQDDYRQRREGASKKEKKKGRKQKGGSLPNSQTLIQQRSESCSIGFAASFPAPSIVWVFEGVDTVR